MRIADLNFRDAEILHNKFPFYNFNFINDCRFDINLLGLSFKIHKMFVWHSYNAGFLIEVHNNNGTNFYDLDIYDLELNNLTEQINKRIHYCSRYNQLLLFA